MRISHTSERFAISQSILVWAPHAFSYQIFVDWASTFYTLIPQSTWPECDIILHARRCTPRTHLLKVDIEPSEHGDTSFCSMCEILGRDDIQSLMVQVEKD